MAVGGAEDAGAVIVVHPDDGLLLAGAFAGGGGEWSGFWPGFFNDVKLVHGRDPVFGKAFHDGMIFGDDFDGVFGLVFVVLAGDAEEFAPVIDFGGAVGVHGAVNDHRRFAGFVGGGDAADVIFVGGIREAFIVDDHVVWLGPIGVFVEIDLGAGAGAAFIDDGEFHIGDFGDAGGQGFRLKFIIVTAAAGDDEALERFTGVKFFCGREREADGEGEGSGNGSDGFHGASITGL